MTKAPAAKNAAKPKIPKATKDAITAAAKKATEDSKNGPTLEGRKQGLLAARAQITGMLQEHRNRVVQLEGDLNANGGAIQLLEQMISERESAKEKV